MAITQNTYTGNGSTTLYSFTFPYLETTDIRVSLNGVNTTAYTLANATTVQFNTAPANGAAIRIYRQTDDSGLTATFSPGSAIRSQDLNDNFTQNLYVTQESTRDSTQAVSTANSAATTAATALSNSNTAVSTAITASTNATTAVNTANTASSTASSAVSTANTASTNASAAVTTANSATATANSATSTANTALSTANTALSTANTASTNASNAVTTANSASSAASLAVSTANTASSNASSALSTANTASTNATTAINTANAADTKANAAIAAVSSSINYTPVANVAAIPGSPANNTYIEVTDTTGLESFTPLSGLPAGFVGDAGLTARLRYTTTGNTWVWLNYFANNADSRYLKRSGGTMTGKLTLDGNPSSNLHAATKQYVDSADSTLTTAVTAAQSTADAALPKAGGTMTGNITFNATQTFPTSGISAASTTSSGIVQLLDSTSSTSTVRAATPNSVKSVYDLANAALPKSGGTMTGNITFNATQVFPISGISAASTSAAGIVQLSDSTSSASSTTAATSAAVKSTYDFASVVSTTANAALPKAGGTVTGSLQVDGNLTVDTNSLYVDATTHCVGIGTTSPSGILNLDRVDLTTDTWLRVSQSGTEVFSLSQPTASEIRFATPNLTVDRAFTFYTTGLERVRIDSSGRLLVGTSTSVDSNAKLQTYASSGTVLNHIESGSLANNTFAGCQIKAEGRIAQLAVYKHSGITNNCAFLYLQEENGTNAYIWADNSGVLRISATATHVGTTSGTVVGAQTSDERLKNILGPVEYGLETLKQLDPVRYSLKSEPENEKLGFIAQQVQPLIPQSVFDTNEHIEGEPEDAPTKLGMEYVALIPVLVNAIKELSAEVDALKAQLQVQ